MSENGDGTLFFRPWEQALLAHEVLIEPVIRFDSDEVFQFGKCGQLKALFAAEMPVTVYGVGAQLRVCVVAGQTPLLLSRAAMQRLGLCINFSKNTLSSQKLNIRDQPVLEAGGHLVLNLMDENIQRPCQAYKAEGSGNGSLLTGTLKQQVFGDRASGSR